MGLIAPTKTFSTKFVNLTPLPPLGNTLFWDSFLQAKYLNINFWAWSFYNNHLKCIFSSIMWFINFCDHTQPDFQPHLYLVILIPVNWRKIDFYHDAFIITICLECILSNINCRKAFCLFWVTILYDHTHPDFQPRPFLQVKSLKFRLLGRYFLPMFKWWSSNCLQFVVFI